jgi:hypothetical protein
LSRIYWGSEVVGRWYLALLRVLLLQLTVALSRAFLFSSLLSNQRTLSMKWTIMIHFRDSSRLWVLTPRRFVLDLRHRRCHFPLCVRESLQRLSRVSRRRPYLTMLDSFLDRTFECSLEDATALNTSCEAQYAMSLNPLSRDRNARGSRLRCYFYLTDLLHMFWNYFLELVLLWDCCTVVAATLLRLPLTASTAISRPTENRKDQATR